MDAMHFFLPLHELMHGQITDRFSQLTDAQMRLRPHPNMNSIAWLLWHIARSEDMGQSADRQSPRCPCEGWASRLNLSRHDMGTGMTDEEVAEFSARVNTVALREYSVAVGPRTQEIVRSLRAEALDEVQDASHIRKILVEEEVIGPTSPQAPEWTSRSSHAGEKDAGPR